MPPLSKGYQAHQGRFIFSPNVSAVRTAIEIGRDTIVAHSLITSGWHIVLCEPNRELTAVAGMTDPGFEASCPCDYIRRRTGRRDVAGRPVLSMEASPKAAVPGYAFRPFRPHRWPDGGH
jgi:hypothetical protein